MARRFFAFFLLVFLSTCDDGDIINVQLEFDEELDRCDNFENFYLLYDTREDPNEALILSLPKPAFDYLFTDETQANEPHSVEIGSSTGIRFNYRTYSNVLGDDVLCDELSDPSIVVIDDYETDGGTVKVTVTIVDDDNDGIPTEDEDLDGDGDPTNDDFDNDGIPNYLDEDDDNDNVKTINEDDNDDGDNNPFTNPRNTDGEDQPDYLDTDDDNDGILTRLEDPTEDENPLNDFVPNEEGMNVRRFLYNHPTAMEAFPDSGFIDNTYTRTTTSVFVLEDIGLDIIDATIINLGSFVSPIENITTEND
ncbi:hypothetical protein [Winogradskyella sp. A2]|uniref:hypothetical protein n=1 Tax=Winogradskyella sp. A2 TaxID=3366944 RepID=UPI00398C2850